MISYKKLPKYKYILTKYFCKRTPIKPENNITSKYITLTTRGLMFLKKGYCSDGVSGPIFDTEDLMEDAFVHDAFYQLIRLGLLEPHNQIEIDRLLKDMALTSNLGECGFVIKQIKRIIRYVRANYIYAGVKLFGSQHCKPEK